MSRNKRPKAQPVRRNVRVSPEEHGGGRKKELARVISRAGFCSRSQAAEMISAGQVRVNGQQVRDPCLAIVPDRDEVLVAGQPLRQDARIYIMLNKPRGLVTSRSDDQGRATVFECLKQADLPYLAPVGRLDKASEGLLLLTNDSQWAAAITDPARGPSKTYHVQIDMHPDPELFRKLLAGVDVDGIHYRCSAVSLLRVGTRNAWICIELEEGRNRQIRVLLNALNVSVLRLVRVAIGTVTLGNLPKSQWRELSEAEVAALAAPAVRP